MPSSALPKANLEKVKPKIIELAKQGAQIICLQELFTSLYFCDTENHDNFKLAESIPGPSTDFLSPLEIGRAHV